jgi:hypothetical protein
LIYPLLMATTVIVTGNHYLSDAIGAELVVLVAVAGATLLAARKKRSGSIARALAYLRDHRHGEPVCLAEESADRSMGSSTAAA